MEKPLKFLIGIVACWCISSPLPDFSQRPMASTASSVASSESESTQFSTKDFNGNFNVPSHPAAQICTDVTIQGLVCMYTYIYIDDFTHNLCWRGWREYLCKFNHIGSKCSPVLSSFNILRCSCSMACQKNVSMVPHEAFLKPSQKPSI